ncbi:exo-alpha-sialidase [Streptomyces luteolus]|uniref:exo-alpha-sialidase n=1 Tax=Streptomyces luteolus TaxID=3043615 RepID=A0ABT6T8G6_9ACTN|nr:exo-alpha-sialidase [Streptomyces sp. B-S-A12]MDI3424170.1 exo-alpha-sialidase [Streptomyces sp. B-S-A12]
MKRRFTGLLATAVLTGFAAVPTQADGPSGSSHASRLVQEDLADRGKGGFPQYRIPALTTTVDGTLIAAYDGRPNMADVPSNIALVVRRSTDGGRTWKQQQIVRQEASPRGYGDPSLLVDRETGRVFLFHAASVNQGYAGSGPGTDHDDPDVLHTDYSYSDDDGRTWKHRRITSQIKTPGWGGVFAASGEGIQLRHGKHAGRLMQQYVVRHNGGNYAASAYSDDHGETWHMGELVGPGADENKTVELSDGTVMLNTRSAPYRKVALSRDGGVTYDRLRPDAQLTDPANNGAIMRLAPDAPASDPRSKWLVFSNTEDDGMRRNLTVKMSCDDGKTWPIKRVVEPGAAGYSTITALPDDRVGMLYERAGYRYMTYAGFDREWLGGVCAPVTVQAPEQLAAGKSADISVTVANQTQKTTAPGTVSLKLPAGWTSRGTAAVPRIAPGKSAEVTVRVTAPRTATGTVPVSADYRIGNTHSSGVGSVRVTADPAAPAQPSLSALPTLDHYDAAGGPGVVGDVMTYWTRVTNTGNTTLTDVTVTGNMSNLPSCRYSSLAAGQSYVCRTAKATVTDADVERGHFTPELTLSGAAPDGRRTTAAVSGDRVDLR